jgi:ribonucleoside-diphosphate reductase alpha chain
MEFIDDSTTYVITRSGSREELSLDQIVKRIKSLINRNPKIPNVNSDYLSMLVCRGMYNDMKTSEIDNYAAKEAASLSITHPYYLQLAARLAIDNHQKNTLGSFVDKMRMLYFNKDEQLQHYPLIGKDFYKYVEEHRDFIDKTIEYTRDFLLDYFGFSTFYSIYSCKLNNVPIERPQDMFMRVAICINMNTHDNIEEEYANIKTTYDLLSNKNYTHATPTCFNAGRANPQLASCFLLGTHDSRKGIMKTATDMSAISKHAGGIGLHINGWRSTGMPIKGTGGKSGGIIKWLKIYNCIMLGFDQGGRRPGSAAIYMMPHHPDIMKFIDAGKNDGNIESRARDLHYALWIPDIFMERVKAKETWSLFDPSQVGDLSNLWGEKYTERYLELEKKKLYIGQINAFDIWEAAFKANRDYGEPYICFADNANKYSMQQNLGTIKSSNLCTEIYLYSDNREYAVCILSSISLPSFVFDRHSAEELDMHYSTKEPLRALDHDFPINPYFDYEKLKYTVSIVTKNLNKVIDKTYHPVKKSKRGNDRHRPIGIGVQGLDDCYAKMRYPFTSDAAHTLNKRVFETIYYAALSESTRECREIYNNLRKQCANGPVKVVQHHQTHYETTLVEYKDSADIPKTVGAYPSMLWNGGSPISKGIFRWELSGLKPEDLSGMNDWESLREHIKIYGVRNSVLTACMPTATTSQLLGNGEGIEPYTSNLYSRNTVAGAFIVIKKYLIHDLYNLKLWTPELKDYLVAAEGSIQNIDGIPSELKSLYPKVREIDPKILVQQAIDRQHFIDQGQSLNLFLGDNLTMRLWTELMFKAWRGGLPTGKYYLRTKAGVAPPKFTIDPEKQRHALELIKSTIKLGEIAEPEPMSCMSCGS